MSLSLIHISPENADLSKDVVDHFNVYVDGTVVGSAKTANYTIPTLAEGAHTVGVSSVYGNGEESAVCSTSLKIAHNASQLAAVDNVAVTANGNSAITAKWQAPVDKDKVTSVSYTHLDVYKRQPSTNIERSILLG